MSNTEIKNNNSTSTSHSSQPSELCNKQGRHQVLDLPPQEIMEKISSAVDRFERIFSSNYDALTVTRKQLEQVNKAMALERNVKTNTDAKSDNPDEQSGGSVETEVNVKNKLQELKTLLETKMLTLSPEVTNDASDVTDKSPKKTKKEKNNKKHEHSGPKVPYRDGQVHVFYWHEGKMPKKVNNKKTNEQPNERTNASCNDESKVSQKNKNNNKNTKKNPYARRRVIAFVVFEGVVYYGGVVFRPNGHKLNLPRFAGDEPIQQIVFNKMNELAQRLEDASSQYDTNWNRRKHRQSALERLVKRPVAFKIKDLVAFQADPRYEILQHVFTKGVVAKPVNQESQSASDSCDDNDDDDECPPLCSDSCDCLKSV